ncbi:hypothetical protein T02_6934 [Trichinella nativa]|uniref:Uncharacterized protein n=1 Tax=Trichinella nativa TaxID=6335 RepID=A0A0V1LAR4_9BILA|nr:hypothetical protein T02_6934 [Trichinella nativa]
MSRQKMRMNFWNKNLVYVAISRNKIRNFLHLSCINVAWCNEQPLADLTSQLDRLARRACHACLNKFNLTTSFRNT